MSTDIHQASLLSVRETATILGVTEKTVRRLIAARRLPALQLGPPGSSIRIPEDELRGAPLSALLPFGWHPRVQPAFHRR
jgi:excisionase family DNA binding protein